MLTSDLSFTIIHNRMIPYFAGVSKAKDTKEKILSAALEMFSKYGYADTNIRELTASLGLVKSGVH